MPRRASGSSSAMTARIFTRSNMSPPAQRQPDTRNRATLFAISQLQAPRVTEECLQPGADVRQTDTRLSLVDAQARAVIDDAEHEALGLARRDDLDRPRLGASRDTVPDCVLDE